MLRIFCPICGERSIEEYAFGGEWPTVPDRITDLAERNIDYVWMFDNLAGESTERWFHEAGCRRWFTVRRDTTTDRVLPTP